jgi:hypothetical protein
MIFREKLFQCLLISFFYRVKNHFDESEGIVIIAFLFFVFACSSESESMLLSSSLQVKQRNSQSSFLDITSLSVSESTSLKRLLEILSPFWKKNSTSDFAIRSYFKPLGGFADQAYVGGVYDPVNDQIVFSPYGQAPEPEWHVYDCQTQRVLSYSKPSGTLVNHAYAGGVYDPINNQILTT